VETGSADHAHVEGVDAVMSFFEGPERGLQDRQSPTPPRNELILFHKPKRDRRNWALLCPDIRYP
jgi:hypothetical protein